MIRRAVQKAAAIAAISVLIWGITAYATSPGAVIEWSNFVSELLVCALVIVWIFIITPASAARKTYLLLLTGFFALYAASFQDLLDEVYRTEVIGRLVEDIGYPLGMSVIAVGLVMWVYEHERNYRRLQSQKRDLEYLTVTDELTGLYNSRHFTTALEQEIERAERYGRVLSLVFIDIDNFKQFNDSHGHLAGNHVLQVCSRIITDALRESDSSYRFGGEEFTVILPETRSQEAAAVAERIRHTFEEHPFKPEGQEPIFVALSAGVAELQPNEHATTLIERADSAMYEAKMRGKNQIVVWNLANE